MRLLAPPPLLVAALGALPGVLPWQMLPLLLAAALVPRLAFMSGSGSGSGTRSSGNGGSGGSSCGSSGSGGGGSSISPEQLPPAQDSEPDVVQAMEIALAAYAKLVWPLLAAGAFVSHLASKTGSASSSAGAGAGGGGSSRERPPSTQATQPSALAEAALTLLAAYGIVMWPLPCIGVELYRGLPIPAAVLAVVLVGSLWEGWSLLTAALQQAGLAACAFATDLLYNGRYSTVPLNRAYMKEMNSKYGKVSSAAGPWRRLGPCRSKFSFALPLPRRQQSGQQQRQRLRQGLHTAGDRTSNIAA